MSCKIRTTFSTPQWLWGASPWPGSMPVTPPQWGASPTGYSLLTHIAMRIPKHVHGTANDSDDAWNCPDTQTDPRTLHNIKYALKVLSQWNTLQALHQWSITQAIFEDPTLATPIHCVSTLCHTILGVCAPTSPNNESCMKLSTSIESLTQTNKQIYQDYQALRSQFESTSSCPTSTQPKPQEGLSESIHTPDESCFQKSATPTPLKPTKKMLMPKLSNKAHKPIFEQLMPTNPMQWHHPGHLIINIHLKIAKMALPSVLMMDGNMLLL